jgi:hypothetical protein
MTDGSQEQIALELMKIVAAVEKKALQLPANAGTTLADRAWIFRTYSECIRVVRKPQVFKTKLFDPL